jgi:hypothetical protein
MLIAQEPKYDVTPEGRIINQASGEIIPDDEPIFIFRARDTYALSVLLYYAQSLSLESEHQQTVMERVEDFRQFKAAHPDRMKIPDTVRNPSEDL